MMPFIPPALAPWIYFGDNTVHLKPDAPEEIRSAFEKLKADMKKADDDQFPKL